MRAMWLCSSRGEFVLTFPLSLWYFYQESQNTYHTGTRIKSVFPLSNKSQLSLMFSPTVSEGKGPSFRLQLVIWLVPHEATRQDLHSLQIFRFFSTSVDALFTSCGGRPQLGEDWITSQQIPNCPWLSVLHLVAESWDLYCPRTSRQVDPSPLQTPQLSSLAVLPSWWSQPTI